VDVVCGAYPNSYRETSIRYTLSTLLLITQIPYIVRVPGKGRNGCILQPKPSNRTLSQLYEYEVGYSSVAVAGHARSTDILPMTG